MSTVALRDAPDDLEHLAGGACAPWSQRARPGEWLHSAEDEDEDDPYGDDDLGFDEIDEDEDDEDDELVELDEDELDEDLDDEEES